MKVKGYLSHERIHGEETFQVAIVMNVQKGYHINSNKPLDEFLVPTFVKLDNRDGVIFSLVSYPEPAMMSFSFSPHEVSVYEGKVLMLAQGKLSEDVPLGPTMITGHVVYQACDDNSCLMPKSAKFELPLEIVGIGEPAKTINKNIFREKTVLTADEQHAKRVIEKGLPYALMVFFIFGLALNLTPCVYPVIPMTVSFFAAQGQKSKGAMLLLASYYVIGIAVIFSVLGLVSGLAGKQWGFLFQNPWFVIFISVIILSMAASMFGAFEITIPSFLMTPLSKSRQGAVGSFIMGLTVGVVIAPCAAGIIIGLIGVVAKLGIVAKGTLLFFSMGLGLGVPYLFLAMSSGLINRLPRSGMWMVWIRKFFGILLIGVAVYFLLPQGKQVTDQQGFYLGVLGIFGGLFLGFLDSSEGYTRVFKIIRSCIGLAFILCGVFLVHGAIKGDTGGIDWVTVKKGEQLLTHVQKENRPAIIDFTAEWCSVCKVLDRKTFKTDRVVEKAAAFSMIKIDCTSPTEEIAALTEKYKVTVLPTVIFMDRKGKEMKELRITGFVSPSEMIARMNKTESK
ncbi:MAG: thioredoxin fold domain-containing protein [Deltaproteobacteria bacterium]|nr:thioredoxin fold domain-containing protein [Deltaproteobacteria bacterium]